MVESSQLPWADGDNLRHSITNEARHLAEEIFKQISKGTYQPGMKLPAERDLAERHAVTRTTVRQALALLKAYDVIDRRQGSGSFVCPARPMKDSDLPLPADMLSGISDLSQITSPLELGIVRSIFEPEMVRLAVLNITSRDIRKMREILNEMDMVKTDGAAFSQIDDRLRLHLAECTRNPLLLAIGHISQYVSTHADWARRRREGLSPGQISGYAARNRALAHAIENRDVETAVEHLKLALADFHRDLVQI